MKELELILQAVAQLGDAGKEAFIWWLVMDKGLTVIGWLGAVSMLSFAIVRVVAMIIGVDDTKLACLRDAMGVGSPGYFTSEEFSLMLAWVQYRKDLQK